MMTFKKLKIPPLFGVESMTYFIVTEFKKNIKRNFFEILIILLAFLIINNQDKIKNLFNQNNNQNQNDYINTNNNLLKVHYLDVGQGDSIFIELPNNETMLIDAAESYQSENIIN